jgi:hypothetical protein
MVCAHDHPRERFVRTAAANQGDKAVRDDALDRRVGNIALMPDATFSNAA